MSNTKQEAARLLRKYDKMRHELRALEHELAKACVAYGKETGRWGWNRDNMRSELEREKEQNRSVA
jgi:hypothetical protein